MSDTEILRAKREAYTEARAAHEHMIREKENKADAFRLRAPEGTADGSLVNLLNVTKGDRDDLKAEASVRDIAESIEVIVVRRKANGRLHLLPWIGDESRGVRPGAEISVEYVPESDVARLAAACAVLLPMRLCLPHLIDKLIETLERRACDAGVEIWQESPYLSGLLPLILDENLQTELCGYDIEYSEAMGLSVSRKDGEQ
jgi:hypothetical protein